jgi:hypothetical protein
MNLHPIIHSGLARERERDVERATKGRRLARLARHRDQAAIDGLVIRQAVPDDEAALGRLAALHGRARPRGEVLVATAGGAIHAAIGVPDGEVIADPFAPTADLAELLRLRVQQASGALGSRPRPGR